MLQWIVLAMLLAPPASEVSYREGVARFERGDAAGAVPFLEEAARLNPKKAQAWKALGVALASQGDYRAALEPLSTACRLDPSLPDACYFAGRALYASDLYDTALEPLKKALAFDSDRCRVETAIAQAMEALGRNAEAETNYLSALKRKSASLGAAQLAYGRFLIRLGRAGDALDPLRAAYQAQPDAETGTALGQALVELDRFADALAPLEKAIEADPNKVAPRLLLARIYRRLGRTADAVRQETAALRIQGSETTRN